MTIKLLIDMNLSPDWVPALQAHGWEAVHWSQVGDPGATDRELMDWAQSQGYVIFTHDLDFGAMLALTHASGPSVLQIRAADILPDTAAAIVNAALEQHEGDLESGALVVVDANRSRVRVLPIR